MESVQQKYQSEGRFALLEVPMTDCHNVEGDAQKQIAGRPRIKGNGPLGDANQGKSQLMVEA